MLKLVVDTKSLLVSTPKKSTYRWFYDALLEGNFQLVVSTEILLEYEEKLSEFYSPEYANLIIQVLVNLPNLLPVNPIAFNWRLISVDPDDHKFVDAYVAAGADYIISDDKHFNALNQVAFPQVQTLKMRTLKQSFFLER